MFSERNREQRMIPSLACHHGHQLRLQRSSTDSSARFLCPICGSQVIRRDGQSSAASPDIDVTLDDGGGSKVEGNRSMPSGSPEKELTNDGQGVAAGKSQAVRKAPRATPDLETYTRTLHPHSAGLETLPELAPSLTIAASAVRRVLPPHPSDSGFGEDGDNSNEHRSASWGSSEAAHEVNDAEFAKRSDLAVPDAWTVDGAPVAAESLDRLEAMNWGTAKTPKADVQEQQNDEESAGWPELADYEIVRELGRGGMGVVYLARHVRQGHNVALKTLQRISPSSIHQFKAEFRALADISHPNLATLYELISDGCSWWFTMEVLDGVTFLEYVWSGLDRLQRRGKQNAEAWPEHRQLTEERLQRLANALTQLAVGLNALHENGMLHRDIKPSNVMVTREGRVVLLDFGLVARFRADRHSLGVFQGTPEYMAPEQAKSKEISESCDWYAVGVMLYEVLTGRLPFTGEVSAVLARKQQELPPQPIELEPKIPAEWNSLCMALLNPEPSQRPSVIEVLRHIGSEEVADQILADRSFNTSGKVQLVGRETQLQTLRKAFAKVVDGGTFSVFVQGRSGMGKSVLIRQFFEEIRQRGKAIILRGQCDNKVPVILSGRCNEQESMPFKALDSLIDSLCLYLDDLATEKLWSIMPADSHILARTFPVLGKLQRKVAHARVPIENVGERELRQRTLAALRELLSNLGARQPLILYVDDLQWGDEGSAGLLADLVRPPNAPRLLMLGAYRSEDIPTSPCLRKLVEAYNRGRNRPECTEVIVDALSQEDARRLAWMLLESRTHDRAVYADKIARESGGWPFFVWELAQHVQSVDDVGDGGLELDEVIWQRVCRLPRDTRELLELIAVSGRPLSASLAYQAAGDVSRGPSLLVQLRTSGLLRVTESDNETLVECYHDRIRESVVSHLEQRVAKTYSARLASVVERASDVKLDALKAYVEATPAYEEPGSPPDFSRHQWQVVFDLAHYCNAAEAGDRALTFALVAAEQARSRNALDVAQQQYEIAKRWGKYASTPVQFRIAEGLGDVLMLRGYYDKAEEQLRAALELARGKPVHARLEGKLGELAFKRGDMALASVHIERALAELGRRTPRNIALLYALAAKEGLVQMLHTWSPKLFVGRKQLDESATDMLAVRLYDRLSYAYWFSRGLIQTFWAHLRQLNLAELYPPTSELAQAYSLHAPVMGTIGLFDRGVAYAIRSREIRRDLGDIWGQGQSLHFHGVVLYAASRFEDSIAKCREAIQLLEQTGDVWEANMARYHLADSLYHLGRLDEAIIEARRVYETGLEVGDAQSIAVILIVWAAAAARDFPADEIAEALGTERHDPLASLQVIQAQGLKRLLYDDQPGEAAKVFEEAIRRARQRGIKNTYVSPNYAWQTTSLRILAQRAEPGSKQQATLVRQALKSAKRSLRVTRRFQNTRPQALREGAILAAMAGDERLALRRFGESIALAEEQNAAYQRALTQLAKAEMGRKFGWEDAEQEYQRARREIAKFRPEDSPLNKIRMSQIT